MCVFSHITCQGKVRCGQSVFCWTSESGCYILKDIPCVFHPHFYKTFAVLLSCGGEDWKRFCLPLEGMFSAAVLPGLTRGDSCPKVCVQTMKTVLCISSYQICVEFGTASETAGTAGIMPVMPYLQERPPNTP